ncbi:MAG TPA: SDR family NAD(P)-dependent oxidoreductase [Pseudolabrys sp.]|nr:SDR family NAD(P)-dependent oxidoreductase [Pseudolabrys sp.]
MAVNAARYEGTKAARRLDGAVALVTGAGGGIGRAVADRLAQEGATLVLADRSGAAAAAQSLGGDTLGIKCDVSVEGDVAAMFDRIRSERGRLDIVVNNAGISPRVNGRKSLVEDTSLEMWRMTLDVNLTGTFLVSRGAIPLLKQSSQGRIINMGSIAARMRNQHTSSYYATSKAGMLGFSRVLAGELAAFGITVNYVAPTRIATDLARTYSNPGEIDAFYNAAIPLGRVGMPADVASVVAFLASPEAAYLTGAVIDVNGGQYMA